MGTTIVFETHSLSADNERRVASGWSHSHLSNRGRELARELAERRRDDGLAAVFASDLRRAAETAEVAFPGGEPPVLLDWRLRECDYGTLNARPVAEVHDRRSRHLDAPYPAGESWRQAVGRVAGWLEDVPRRWDGTRILVIGHVATRWALDHHLRGAPLEQLVDEEFEWQGGWEYRLGA